MILALLQKSADIISAEMLFTEVNHYVF
ncbi:hypothetical protein PM8797T_20703 [Gimesia maris DSM 8797]|nr:hypothetical protein PM8797T_20703 [Gimesia maris DSM 8797]